jgi:hypothetical protein
VTDDRAIVQKHVNECLQRAEERIDWLLKLEDRPFSLNIHYLTDYKYKFLAHYKGLRKKDQKAELMESIESYRPSTSQNTFSRAKTVEPQETGIAKVLSGLAEMGLPGIKPEDISKLLPADRMEHAVVIMADVRAYFQGQFYIPLHHAGLLIVLVYSRIQTFCRQRSPGDRLRACSRNRA